MTAKKTSFLAAAFLLVGGAFFTGVAIWYLPSVRVHGRWTNVWQPGSVGLSMLGFGALYLWLAPNASGQSRFDVLGYWTPSR